eukprot:gnl/MRDRNA2_/MRDRNA2_131629_c0_seq1.p1 gnl/MRDRNA2_/MRDRNA2_131629_c0~~gnl/MRDRNA2_/MRDRNA2_131629_c0_seq1.p1  ORF type:complete len:504 (-),score=59.15 gnl/MRDRNA2_/MRDRNA2_131629_c0_seq1:30-1541(-)
MMSRRVWLEGVTLVMLATLDNIFCFVTYFIVRMFLEKMYNIVELNLALLWNVDLFLLIFTCIGTMSFVMMVVLVECNKLPLFHEIMTLRLILSALPCGAICMTIVYFAETTQWAPFCTFIMVVTSIFSWCLHMRIRYSQELAVINRILLDISWFFSLTVGILVIALYSSNSLSVITKSDELGCPHTSNEAMPVFVPPLNQWYCSQWNEESPMNVERHAASDGPVQLACGESFVDVFGISIEPHEVECPQGCLQIFRPSAMETGNTNIVGCGVYSADSPVCLAAIHAGALTDAGGITTVYGRLGLPQFERCSRNSMVSDERFVLQSGMSVSVSSPNDGSGSSTFVVPLGAEDGGRRLRDANLTDTERESIRRRLITTPVVLGPNNQRIPQAFHFNNQEQTKEFLWLKKYEKVSAKVGGVEPGKPWTQIEATVSMRIAGLELVDEKVRLGKPEFQPLFVQPRKGQVFDTPPSSCTIEDMGVLCRGAGSASIQLDFCRPEEKTCPR